MSNALSSLYGEGNAAAIRTRECVAFPGKREQEILTPPEILDPLRELWGGRPVFDPFGSERHAIADHTALLEDGTDGQQWTWPDRTFGNPPYGELERAMVGTKRGKPDGATYYLDHVDGEISRWCFLIPVRSHRKWWRRVANRDHVTVLELDPVKFVGFDQAFPAPLCLMFTRAGRKSDIEDLFSHLGEIRR